MGHGTVNYSRRDKRLIGADPRRGGKSGKFDCKTRLYGTLGKRLLLLIFYAFRVFETFFSFRVDGRLAMLLFLSRGGGRE